VSDPTPPDVGLRVIMAYKLGKAALWVALATLLGLLASAGNLEHFRAAAGVVREHLASHWSLALADALLSILDTRALRIVELSLAIDAALSVVEGYALWRGRRWGPWLVVVASALPLPFEAWKVAQSFRPPRVALLVVNLAIVAYLLRWLRRHPGPGPGPVRRMGP
jgi:uncharacterized membrane protein (DUF2068 family)